MRHGHTGTWGKSPTYRSWGNMLARCSQTSNPSFAHYASRGVTVCDRWLDFENFLADMGVRPGGHREYTLERIDNSKGYSPENCRWATWREQGNNRSTNNVFEYKGVAYTLANLARATGACKEVLRTRLVRGIGGPWSVEDAVHTPSRKGYRTDKLGPIPRTP